MTYKAHIEFTANEDNYEQGEISTGDNSWDETLYADTQAELRNKVLEATYSKWADLDDEQANGYDWCTEYHTSYLANADNQGDASESEIEAWKRGECRLWAINCHILVTQVNETKAIL